MPRIHIALSVTDIDASVADYSERLGCAPVLVVKDEYALWRTPTLNFSIRKTADTAAGSLRHLGWEDERCEVFTTQLDVNGIAWERFSAAQQREEIQSIWPSANYETDSEPDTLQGVRERIDAIDREIVALLAKRGRCVKQAARFKASAADVRAPGRVEQVVAKVKAAATELGADPALVEELYRTMIHRFVADELEEHGRLTPPSS